MGLVIQRGKPDLVPLASECEITRPSDARHHAAPPAPQSIPPARHQSGRPPADPAPKAPFVAWSDNLQTPRRAGRLRQDFNRVVQASRRVDETHVLSIFMRRANGGLTHPTLSARSKHRVPSECAPYVKSGFKSNGSPARRPKALLDQRAGGGVFIVRRCSGLRMRKLSVGARPGLHSLLAFAGFKTTRRRLCPFPPPDRPQWRHLHRSAKGRSRTKLLL